ncbi:MAG: antitoxin VapB family protein [Desulfurococcales archaeon]|nr:antitoxin VapB family protein [Desulfurococcales archaeon]
MARTIALSEDVYRKLKQLKDSLGVGYSDLIDMLIEAYRRYRVEELKRLCSELRIDEGEVERIAGVLRELRNRRWW